MGSEWNETTWGRLATLEYGKSLRDYSNGLGGYRVFGTNGAIGWHDTPLCNNPGIIIGRKGAYRGVHYSPEPFFVIDTGVLSQAEGRDGYEVGLLPTADAGHQRNG